MVQEFPEFPRHSTWTQLTTNHTFARIFALLLKLYCNFYNFDTNDDIRLEEI